MNCYLYILDGLADWEISYISAEINSGRYLKNEFRNINLVKIGNSFDEITTIGGFKVLPDNVTNGVDFEEGDLLILPGSDKWMENNNFDVLERIPGLLKKNVTVAAICGATLALANYGILDNRPHTSNDRDYLVMSCPEYKGLNYYKNVPVVVDNNLITATGIAPLEFTYEVINKTGIMEECTLKSWYSLYNARDPKYFCSIIDSINYR